MDSILNSEHIKFHKLGFALHLLKAKSKMPVESKWTTGPRKTWGDLRQSYKLGMNVGVRLGTQSKVGEGYLAVIDCDVKSTLEKHRSQMERALEKILNFKTPVVWSGRGNGSRHCYVRTKLPARPKRLTQSPVSVKVLMSGPNLAPSKKGHLPRSRVSRKARKRRSGAFCYRQ